MEEAGIIIASNAISLFPDLNNGTESDNMKMDPNGYISISNTGLVSDDIMPYIYTINLAIICSLISIFGIVTNVINIIVFVRQGFRETINISLLGLTISDICSLISLLWVGICYNPFFRYNDFNILTKDLQHYTGAWTHVIFTRVTVFITAFITFERCLCVVYPLRVKHLLTPNRVRIVIIAIYVVVIGTMIQNYFVFRFGWKYVPGLNKTMFGMIYLSNQDVIETISYYIQLLYPLFTFSSIVICTGILIWKFKQQIKWRQKTAVGENKDRAINRDRQVVKMVVCLAIIFLISFMPSLILFFNFLLIPGMNLGTKNENLLYLSISIGFASEAINSSVNIFVYYRTSSKYKEQFQALFFKKTISSR